jgi:hypothetical protein
MREDWPVDAAIKKNESLSVLPNDKKKIAILITTCRRAESLEKILKNLEREQDKYDLDFFIVDDGILQNGKKNYWKTINLLWNNVRGKRFDYFIQLPDDVSWEGRLIERAIDQWTHINDPKKICLNLFSDGLRSGKTCWTNYWPVIKSFGTNRYLKTQWVDMIFICENKFFEQLDWTIQPVPLSRWIVNPDLSSGVGQQISCRLHQKNWSLYQVSESLLEHSGHESRMNPGLRIREPMVAKSLPFVFAGMASIPDREGQMKKAISGIISYVDRLFLFLNDYAQVPAWLYAHENITVFLGKTENLNIGDGGKFFGLNSIRENDFYYFTLDDDLLYPPDYVWKMIRKIDQFDRKAIVGCGGYIMNSFVNHFYNDRQTSWHISMKNNEDRPVQILHTGLSAWHSSALDFQPDQCRKANMSDLWLALAAQKNNVPRILIQRPPDWVINQPNPEAKTIFGRYRNNCQEQTDIFNSLQDWKLVTLQERK